MVENEKSFEYKLNKYIVFFIIEHKKNLDH